ncbi:MAG: DUF4340 domain-containing protein [Chloroflexi bacterium]|nr:DUF4340 domain-containing protein [Chloroflexota bacterium]
MSFKTTGVLLVILATLGGYVYLFPPPDENAQQVTRPPYVWEVDMYDITHLDVTYQDKTVSMDWDTEQKQWHFRPESSFQGEIDQVRVNGIRLLLSGPGSKRKLEEAQGQDLAPFGLTQPTVVANITVSSGDRYRILVGDATANGQSHYVFLDGQSEIWLVDYTWGSELARFVQEPPLAKEPEAAE